MATRLALRRRREELDLSQEAVALLLGVKAETYRSWEAGVRNPRVGRRRQLANVLQWSVTQLAQALDGEVGAGVNGHVVPSWLEHVTSLEQAAGAIQAWEPVVVHGLLQTEAYARALESIRDDPADFVEGKVRIRLARQAVLTRSTDPLRLSVVLDESVLLRVAGDRGVMADQLAHLASMAELPNVTLQVMPISAAVFPAGFGAFWLVTSPGVDRPYMACIEDGTGPHYLDRPYDINHHTDLFDYLTAAALSPGDTVDLIHRTRKEHYEC